MVDHRANARLSAFIDWIRRWGLTTWSEAGWDEHGARFRERLGRAGEGLAVPHRSMVQARQIYVFARAARIGWLEDGAYLAELAMASLFRDFGQASDQGLSFAFSIDPESGAIISEVRDAYAHAFVLFAIAALYDLNHDQRLLDAADATIRFIQTRMIDQANGGLFDALPVTRTIKRQNPHMHLLEAYLALEQAAPERGYATHALDLVSLFKTRFVKPDHGILLEYFNDDWSTCADSHLAGIWEPGHHFEWVWLLTEAQRLTGEAIEPWAERLYDLARRHGIAPDGRIYDELSSDLYVVKSSHRLWPHTEAIKAAVVRSVAGDPTAPAFADAMAGHLLDTFLGHPFEGGWIDHVAPDGTPLIEGVPASSLYHLFFAASEATKLYTCPTLTV